MLTRRRLLRRLAAGAIILPSFDKPQGLSPRTTRVSFAVPAGACDCHVHVFGDPKQFPFFAGRVYTPDVASPDELAALHKSLGIQRVVIVTPSVYGTDNAATVYGLKARGRDARGVAVIDADTPESALDTMSAAGVRGIRLNLATSGINDPAVGRDRLTAAIARVQRRNWHIQINTTLGMIAAVKDLVLAAPVPVVFDHFGGAVAELGAQQPNFGDLLEVVRSGHGYVKISAAYRVSTRADFADVPPLALALIAANPDRILWGTDWPHPDSAVTPGRKPTDIAPRIAVDDGQLLNQLVTWAPEPALRRKILVDNPARLYGF